MSLGDVVIPLGTSGGRWTRLQRADVLIVCRNEPGSARSATYSRGHALRQGKVNMNPLGRMARISAFIVLGGLPAGCGGGYGSGGSSMMATASFISPMAALSVNLGQSVKLAWTSTGTISCTATASAAGGGSFSGNQPSSGSATVVPTGTGSFTYTLNCGGGGGYGGGASATSATVTVKPSILSTLATAKAVTIGSTIDPIEHGGNPYGLAIASESAGLITAGDLIVCNFNDGATNTQGQGTTLVGLHPAAGSSPYRIAQSASLKGCAAVAVFPDSSISGAAFTANAVPLVSPNGTIGNPFSAGSGGFDRPWSQAYIAASGQRAAALYVSNFAGAIVRISLDVDAETSSTEIATGFCTSGAPGALFAPAGLTYDPAVDALYIVDTSSNSVIAFSNVSSIGADGVVVNGQCASVKAPPTATPTFSGPAASSASVIAHGGGFIAPISAALLSDGDLVVGNGDINIAAGQMPNLLFEISPVLPGGFVGQPVQLDSGTPGALFGITATVDSHGNQLIYFNDDNANAVMLLAQ